MLYWSQENNESIYGFFGEYRFLSNFYPLNPDVGIGKYYKTVEHAYQSNKVSGLEKQQMVLDSRTPEEAKRLSNQFVKDGHHYPESIWKSVKTNVMFNLVKEKFEHDPELMRMLLATDDRTLIEANTCGDDFWGVIDTSGQGMNMLGQMLMLVRCQIQYQQQEIKYRQLFFEKQQSDMG